MPLIPEFLESLKRMEEIHRKKNDDYASPNNPLSNFDISSYMLSHFTNPRDQSFVWPIATKLARLSTLLNRTEAPNNESISDSLIDIANYVLLWDCDIKRRSDINLRCTYCHKTLRGSYIAKDNTYYCDETCVVLNSPVQVNELTECRYCHSVDCKGTCMQNALRGQLFYSHPAHT